MRDTSKLMRAAVVLSLAMMLVGYTIRELFASTKSGYECEQYNAGDVGRHDYCQEKTCANRDASGPTECGGTYWSYKIIEKTYNSCRTREGYNCTEEPYYKMSCATHKKYSALGCGGTVCDVDRTVQSCM